MGVGLCIMLRVGVIDLIFGFLNKLLERLFSDSFWILGLMEGDAFDFVDVGISCDSVFKDRGGLRDFAFKVFAECILVIIMLEGSEVAIFRS